MSSMAPIAEASEVPLMSSMIVVVTGGSTIRIACGSTTKR